MMEMDYDYNNDGTIENLTFEGLDGTEEVSTLREALALLQILNPLDDYRRQLEAGEAPPMASGETDTLLEALQFWDKLWCSSDENESRRTSVNVLTLLAKTLEQSVNDHIREKQRAEEYRNENRLWLEAAAMLGDVQAQKHYADRLYKGTGGFCQDRKKAAAFMLKAAKRGDAEAQNCLGTYYTEGDGVKKDYQKAREWFERAAAQEQDGACFNLGLLYDEGKGVEQDYRKAHDYYLKEYENSGNAKAACNLGYLYLHGKGTPKDEKKAFSYYMKAAHGGYKPAMLTFADLCERGIGAPKGQPHLKWARDWRAKAGKA